MPSRINYDIYSSTKFIPAMDPPTAIGRFVDGRFVANDFNFEAFECHYYRIMTESTAKLHDRIVRHPPRRSPRLVGQTIDRVPLYRTIKKENKRNIRAYSASSWDFLVPVMKFSVLKRKRTTELNYAKKFDYANCVAEETEDKSIIEIKDDSEIDETEANHFTDELNNNNEPALACDEPILIEDDSPCASPVEEADQFEMNTSDREEETPPPSQYENHYEEEQLCQRGHHMAYSETAAQYQCYNSYPPPPSLTPDSPSYNPYADPQFAPPFPPQAHPYNAHLLVHDLSSATDCNGASIRVADFTLTFGIFHLKMLSNVVFTTIQEMAAFDAHFLKRPTYDYSVLFGNTMPATDAPQHHHGPQPTMHETEVRNDSEPTYDDVTQDNCNSEETMVHTETGDTRDVKSTTSENADARMEDGVIECFDIDPDEEEHSTPIESSQRQRIEATRANMLMWQDTVAQNESPQRHAPFEEETKLPANIRLRTDLTNEESMDHSSPHSCDGAIIRDREVCYEVYKHHERPECSIKYGETIYQDTDLETFLHQIPYLLGLRVPMQIEEIP